MKRRNAEFGLKPRRLMKQRNNKITEGIVGSNTTLYIKCFSLWAFVILLDFMLDFCFEFLWPFWMFLRSVNDSYRYKGLRFTIFFMLITVAFDLICLYFIPVSLLFLFSSIYIWVNYVWHTDKGICLPTCMLWILFIYLEVAIRWKDIVHIPYMQWGRPFATHCIGYQMVKLAFAFRKYICNKMHLRKQDEVVKQNAYSMKILSLALPGNDENTILYSNKVKDRGCGDVLSASAALAFQSTIDFFDSATKYISNSEHISNNHNNTDSSNNVYHVISNNKSPTTLYKLRRPGNGKSSTNYHSNHSNIAKENNDMNMNTKFTEYQKILNDNKMLNSSGMMTENDNGHFDYNDNSNTESYHEQQQAQPQIETSSPPSPPPPPSFMYNITDTIQSLNTISEHYFSEPLYTSSLIKSTRSTQSEPESSKIAVASTVSASLDLLTSSSPTQIETNQIDSSTNQQQQLNEQNDMNINNSIQDNNYFIPFINNNNDDDDQQSTSSDTNHKDIIKKNVLKKVFKYDYLQNKIINENEIDNHYLMDDHHDYVNSNDNNNNNNNNNNEENTTKNEEICINGSMDNAPLINDDQQQSSSPLQITSEEDINNIQNCDLKINKPIEMNVEHSKASNRNRRRRNRNKNSQKDNNNTKLKMNKTNNYHKNNNKNKSNNIIIATKVKDNQVNNNNNNNNDIIGLATKETIKENNETGRRQQSINHSNQPQKSISSNNCIKCSDLIDSIKRHKTEIKQLETNEIDLKQQMESLSQTNMNIIKNQQTDMEMMRKRIESLMTARYTDQQHIENVSRELMEEQFLRQRYQIQYCQEFQRRGNSTAAAAAATAPTAGVTGENLTWNNIECSDRCKQKKLQLETELKQLRRELTRSDELNRAKEQKIRNYEQELRNLKIDFRHLENNEILLNACRVLQEKNAILETNLSAETRIKLDLFSALGETKRELEIKDGLLRSQEYALNIDRGKDDVIIDLKSQVSCLLQYITPMQEQSRILRQSQEQEQEQQQQQQQQQQMFLKQLQELSNSYVPSLQSNVEGITIDPIFYNNNNNNNNHPNDAAGSSSATTFLNNNNNDNFNTNTIHQQHHEEHFPSSQMYNNVAGNMHNNNNNNCISSGNCNCAIDQTGENGYCLNFINSTNKMYMRSPSPQYGGLRNMEICNTRMPNANSTLITSKPTLALSNGYSSSSSSTSSLSSGCSSSSSSSSSSITPPSSISISHSTISSSSSSSLTSNELPIMNNSMNNLRELSYNTQELFRSMLSMGVPLSTSTSISSSSSPISLFAPSLPSPIPHPLSSSVLSIIFPSPPSSPPITRTIEPCPAINPSTTTRTTTIITITTASTITTTTTTTTTSSSSSSSTTSSSIKTNGMNTNKNPQISNLDPNAMVYTPKNILIISSDDV